MENDLYIGPRPDGNNLYLDFDGHAFYSIGTTVCSFAGAVRDTRATFSISGVAEAEGIVDVDYAPQFSPIYLGVGYIFDGTNVNINIANLPGLTTTEAGATTGDWREIMRAIFAAHYAYQQSKPWSERPRTFEANMVEWFSDPWSTKTFQTFKIYTNEDVPPNVVPEP